MIRAIAAAGGGLADIGRFAADDDRVEAWS